MKPIVRKVIWVLLAVVVIMLLVRIRAARVNQLAAAPPLQQAVPSVQVASARVGQVTTAIDEQGNLASETETAVASQVLARCIAVYKHEGDYVHTGEVIARLDDQELENIHAAQEADVLSGREAVSAQQAEVARAREDTAARGSDVKGAEAAVAVAQSDVTAAQQTAAAALSDVDAARQTAAGALSDVDTARQTAAAAASDVTGGQQTADAESSKVQQARENIASLLADAESARQTAAGQQAEVDRARENLAAAISAASTQKSRTARDKILFQNKAIAQEQWEASQTAQVEADAAVGALKQQIQSLSRSVDAAQSRVASILSGVAAARQQVLSLQSAAAAAKQRIISLQAVADAAKQRIASVQSVADAAKQRIASLQAVADAAQQRVASLQHSVNAANQRVASLRATEANAQQNILAQQSTAAAAEQKVNSLASTASVGETRIGYTVIRAPYDALVTARLAEPGDLLAPGQAIYRILKPGSVKVVVNVPQESMASIQIGTPVTLTSHGQTMPTSVTRVYPALTGSRLGTVEIVLPSAPFGLKSGSTLEVAIQVRSRNGLVVPTDSIFDSNRGEFVYVVENGVLNCQAVAVISRNGQEAVLSGALQPGDQVVVAQTSELMSFHSGEKVQPAALEGSR